MPLKIRNKKVLVTGGGGFIGSNLVETFLQQENDVVCLDNFSTGRRENINEFLNNDRFLLVEGDITSIDDCRKAVEGVDFVFHQAALGSVPRSIKDPVTTNRVNIDGFLNMLVASRDAGVSRFIFASSSSVYGDHPALPKIETNIGIPLSPYAMTKHANEHYARLFHELYGFDMVGLRYFNVFGKRQDPEGEYAAVIPRFIKTILDGRSPVIFGDGTQSRDFTYIDNVVLANQLAATSSNKQAINQVYNVACGDRITLLDVTHRLIKSIEMELGLNRNIEPSFGPERKGDIKHSHASIEKAIKLLGYQPSHTFDEGIDRSIRWYIETLS